jgi:Ca2+-binding RTX toxin-like protein
MAGNAHGGNDVLKTDGSLLSGTHSAFLYGDAYSMSEHAVAGNDILVGGMAGTSDTLIGDAHDMHGNAKAGNDVLISGGADDSMYGDAVNKDAGVTTGHDTFVFAPTNGQDTINDFEHGKDLIDLTAFASTGVHAISNLNIEVSGNNSIIHFDVNDTITVVGNPHLQASDFYMV